MNRLAWGPLTTIRLRLGGALALALAPVLALGLLQAALSYQKDGEEQRVNLGLAAERSAATARARIESASVLLETLAPQSVGLDCAQRLSEVSRRLQGYVNLVRFSASGRVICAADTVPADPGRGHSAWFSRLAAGEDAVVAPAPAALSPGAPALLSAARAEASGGGFGGAMAAVISLDSLRPDLHDRALPPGTQMAIADSHGRFLIRSDPQAFAPPPAGFAKRAVAAGSMLYRGRDGAGGARVFSAVPFAGDLFLILSAPTEGLFSWAQLNPLSSILFPLLAFTVALGAVWIVTERVVLRWLLYLQRIAAIYAKGRYTVRPVQADIAPPEIRELAHTLETMAEAIAARDSSLQESLAQKDALMREIHHRVKNNLQVITSLLNMQQRTLSDPAARSAMSDTRQRIGALALIYRALYQGPDLKRVDLRQFLGELIGQLVVERQGAGAPVRTEMDADELIIDPDKLAPIALFAVEAISNAQKHVLSARGGVLRVRFLVLGEEAELSISDEGSGAGPPPVVGEGVGRTLMSAFARQLRGRLELAANAQGGITARLTFPTPSAGNGAGALRGRAKRSSKAEAA
jgi:two-component sensor histidine kinase